MLILNVDCELIKIEFSIEEIHTIKKALSRYGTNRATVLYNALREFSVEEEPNSCQQKDLQKVCDFSVPLIVCKDPSRRS